ncbi:MAG: mRNA surveillance protein pelota [Candidatus ainarchaeum sp.]|jgi:mRNA surveillance protein pelota|nr:mRNA surveillance protein pelota [Candidatus ainarchaeum sp.]
MNIINIDYKTKEIVFIPQTIEDLWVIKTIVLEGDVISGSSYRRLKNEQTGESDRKPVFVKIDVEKKDYSSTLNSLRFTGRIIFSKPEDFAPLGEYHTIEVSLLNKFSIIKKELFDFQIDLLKKASSLKNKINVVILDDEISEIYMLSGISNENIANIKSGKHGKRYNQSFDFTNFFESIYSVISNNKEQLIIAGPGGTKNLFSRYLVEKYNISSLVVNLSSTSKSAINELLGKKEILKFFENSIIVKEKNMIDSFKENLGKDNSLAIYGYTEILNVLKTGACDFILISYSLWQKDIDKIQNLIKEAEKYKTKVHVVDERHDEVIKTLNSFGGIISVLRYKLF